MFLPARLVLDMTLPLPCRRALASEVILIMNLELLQ